MKSQRGKIVNYIIEEMKTSCEVDVLVKQETMKEKGGLRDRIWGEVHNEKLRQLVRMIIDI